MKQEPLNQVEQEKHSHQVFYSKKIRPPTFREQRKADGDDGREKKELFCSSPTIKYSTEKICLLSRAEFLRKARSIYTAD